MERYDSPNATVRREATGQTEAGGAATTEYAKFASFQKMKLKKAHALITTAGTVTGHGFDVYSGTSSLGSILCGTEAALTNASSDALDTAVAAMGQVSVKSLADTAGKAIIVYEFEVDHDAVKS